MSDVMDKNTVLICVAIVLIALIAWFIGTLNRLRKYRVIIEESRKTLILRSLKDMIRFAKCLKLRSRLQSTKKQP